MATPPADLSVITRPALFCDFDGTLVEIAATPDAVRLDSMTRDALSRLAHDLEGAVAIVTGREIAVVDGFLAPLKLPVAGVHGAERRASDGQMTRVQAAAGLLEAALSASEAVAARHPGVIVERKSQSIGLHYRNAPGAEGDALEAMSRVAGRFAGTHLQKGKMVVEVRPGAVSKATAIEAFMAEPPFLGRVPVFAGDDVTDEDAFEIVNALGGVSIKIGDGATAARHSLATTAEFVAWLARQAKLAPA